MTCNTFHLINGEDGCFAIQRGVDLGSPPANGGIAFVVVDTDLTGYTPVGQIRKNYAHFAPDVEATFLFDPPLYGTHEFADGSTKTGTLFIMKLPGHISKDLEIPSKQFTDPDAALVGKNCWLYDVQAFPPGGEMIGAIGLVAPSYVQVTGEVSL